MKTTQEMWTDFIKAHAHISVQDLEDIGRLIDCAYDMGHADGLERGQQHLMEAESKIFDLFKG